MKLTLIREPSGADITFGVLFVDGFYQCLTLENSHKIIPLGTYALTKYFSPHNERDVPLLNGVPQRSDIEIHPANWFYQLEGCIATGLSRNDGMLMDSVAAFNVMMGKLNWTNLSIEIRML